MAPPKGCRPKNWETFRALSRQVQFGKGAHRLCEAVSRNTGERCRRVAVKDCPVCYVHGGAGVRNRRLIREGKPLIVTPARAKRRQECLTAIAVDQGNICLNDPLLLKEIGLETHLAPRGRRIAAALNRDLNR